MRTMSLNEMFEFVESKYGNGFNSVQSKLRRDGSFLLKATNEKGDRTYLLGQLVSEELGFRLEGTTAKEYGEAVDVREEDPLLHEVDVALIRMVIEYHNDDYDRLVGRYYAKEGAGFVVCDNTEGEAYTESFKKFETVEMYLEGEELDYCYEFDRR